MPIAARVLMAMLRSGAGVALFASAVLVAHAAAARWIRDSVAARLSATVALSVSELILAFEALSIVRAFVLPVALVLFVVPAWRLRSRSQLLADLRLSASALRALPSRDRALLAGGLAVVFVRVARGLLLPPLAWDALTYHLPRAARWIQERGWTRPLPAPNAWGYYGHFPPFGDVLWSWAMLPWSADAWIALAGGCVWLAGLLASFALSRQLGASRSRAMLIALAIALVPGVEDYVTSAYVDPVFLALLLLGILFVARAHEETRRAREPPTVSGTDAQAARDSAFFDACLGGACFALGLGTRFQPAAILGFAISAVLLARLQRAELRQRWLVVFAFSALALFAPFALEWIWTGSPFTPLAFELGPIHLPGNAQFVWAHANSTDSFWWPDFVKSALWRQIDVGTLMPDFGDPVGLGPALLLVPIGIFQLIRLARRRPLAALFWIAMLVTCIAPLAAPSVRELWGRWVYRSMRLATPGLALLVLLAGFARSRWIDVLLVAVIGNELLFDIPWSFARLDVLALAMATGALGSAALIARRTTLPARLIVVTVALGALAALRPSFRDPAYREAQLQLERDVHVLHPVYAEAWPLWRELDRRGPLRIAATTGWDGIGQNTFIYPLLGSQLQSSVEYVPVTRDGEILDTWPRADLEHHADEQAWLERIRERRIDVLVTLAPTPLEEQWARAHSELFERLPVNAGKNAAWVVKRAP